MQRRLEAGDLLDAQGRLADTGWAAAEVRRYRRAARRIEPMHSRIRIPNRQAGISKKSGSG